ncbi:hypothetical protein GOODEAATRI_007487, partial [Goodea atripinnis]
PYGSAARKRSAQDGVQGAPVNKRKSLLMKPRHYSPSDACEEESEDLAPPQDKEELRNIDTPADGNFKAVNGVAVKNGCLDAASKSCSLLRWPEVMSNSSPQCEPDTSEHLMMEEDEEFLNNEAEDQSQDRMSGALSPQSPYGDIREAEWEPLSLSAKDNSSNCSPSRASEDLSGRNSHMKEECELGSPIGRASIFQADALRYRLLPTEEDSEGEAEVERLPRLDGWALGLHERGLDMSRGRVNLSLLEQAIALQTEQRQALHHAYREMDRFLLEQMSSERRHHRMMDIESRLNYHGGKGCPIAAAVKVSKPQDESLKCRQTPDRSPSPSSQFKKEDIHQATAATAAILNLSTRYRKSMETISSQALATSTKDMLIEVDENGTLDLSMKKCKENGKAQAKTPLDELLPPPESVMAKGGSLLIGPTFYQPLCDRETWENSIPANFSKAHVLQDKEVKAACD